MPIEIRELNVRATVNQQSASSNAQNNNTSQAGNSEEQKEELIKECVQRVLSKLKSMQER